MYGDYSSVASGASAGASVFSSLVSLAISVLVLVGMWMLFKKAGRQGWEAIIPIYNLYTAFDIIYGKGTKFLLLLIPFYNIYVAIKYSIDLAKAYGKDTGYGLGVLFLPVVFIPMLAFSKDTQYTGPVA